MSYNNFHNVKIAPAESPSTPPPLLLHPNYDLYLLRASKTSTIHRTFTPHQKVTVIKSVDEEDVLVEFVDGGVYCLCRSVLGVILVR
jgi:hypothetical protein